MKQSDFPGPSQDRILETTLSSCLTINTDSQADTSIESNFRGSKETPLYEGSVSILCNAEHLALVLLVHWQIEE